jgi:16S rRNA (cytosine967-C5)-methyltransferase
LAAIRPAADARRLAWQVLIAVEQGGFADATLGARLRAGALAPRDRALAAQLVYGTLAWQGLLDHVLGAYGRAPERLDEPLRVLLRMALFQLVKLDRVPPFAAVDTAVELSKEIKGGAASGLINALLRRFLREGKHIDLPERAADLAGHLAVALSHPRWMVEQWLAELGEAETEALLAANNTAAATVVRVNPSRASREQVRDALGAAGVVAENTLYAPHGLVIELAGDPAALPGHREGRFTVQGEASQLVGLLVGAARTGRVLDVCAAPGGKTTLLAEEMGGGGLVVALDRHASGLRHVRAGAQRLRLRNVTVARADATRLPLSDAARFDAVLVDAPCSGLGTLRQHPEIKWRRDAASGRALAAVQRAMLAAAASHVGPDGALIYATCTISRVENDAVVESLLAAQPEFSIDDPTSILPAAARGLVDAGGALRTFPHRHELDGFYAVRLKRSAASHKVRP